MCHWQGLLVGLDLWKLHNIQTFDTSLLSCEIHLLCITPKCFKVLKLQWDDNLLLMAFSRSVGRSS